MTGASDIQESEATYAEVSSPSMAKESFDIDENKCYGSLKVAPQKNAAASDGNRNVVIALVVIIVLVVMLILAVAACCIAFALEISKLKSGMTTLMQPMSANEITQQQASFLLNQLIEQGILLNNSISDIADIKIQLNKTQQLQLNTSLLSLETQLENEQLIGLLNTSLLSLETRLEDIDQYPFFPASSCAALPSSFPSGYYWVRASNGSAVRVYCDMTRSCSEVTGGWMRVAKLDMTNNNHQCPSGLRQRTDSNIRTCVRNTDSPGCSAVQYSTANISYSRVCGKVIAYQYGTTNAFLHRSENPISSTYVDGVSLTHGNPREHIWTFAAALGENLPPNALSSGCQCITRSSMLPPNFIGMDYFCDTGLEILFNSANHPGFLGADPLWDGEGCGTRSTCCSFNTPPWFYKQLPQSTTDDIEMRVCRNEDASNEDIAIEMVEIYVQ